jgi:hypothetical protein
VWSIEQSEQRVARHDVTPAEVEQAVFTRPQWEATGRESSTLVYGSTDAGRRPLVVLVDSAAESDAWYVVTARDMTITEKRMFAQKAR